MSSPSRILPVETLRALSVMAVMVSHWLPESPLNQVPLGRMGVDMFFVISGFLITGILLEGREKAALRSESRWRVWRNFFIRRVLRLFPLYYFAILLLVLFNPKAIMGGLPWHLTYTSNYYIISIDKWPGIVSHLWSLAVEEHFYLVWPFLILFLPEKRILPAILTVLIGGVLFRLYLILTGGSYISTYIATPSCADALAMGGLLAWMWRFRADALRKALNTAWFPLLTLLLSALSMACKELALPLWGIYIVFFRLCFSAFCFWIIGKSAFGWAPRTQKLLSLPALVYLGQISYGLYLFHNFIPGMLLGLPWPTVLEWRCIIYLIVDIAAASLTWYLIERPVLRLKERFR